MYISLFHLYAWNINLQLSQECKFFSIYWENFLFLLSFMYIRREEWGTIKSYPTVCEFFSRVISFVYLIFLQLIIYYYCSVPINGLEIVHVFTTPNRLLSPLSQWRRFRVSLLFLYVYLVCNFHPSLSPFSHHSYSLP